MNIKAVLFDLDGVLVDSIDAWFYTFNDALRHFGLKELKKEEFERNFGKPIEKDIEVYFKGKTEDELVQLYNLFFKKRKSLVKLFPDSIDALQNLKKQKLKMGLISNSTKTIVLDILNHFKLKKYFNAIVTMEDVERRKPAPDMVLKACKILNSEPRNTVLIGDTKNDMQAGKNAGCITIGFKTSGDYKINSLEELNNLLK